jgi:hypothetical protein
MTTGHEGFDFWKDEFSAKIKEIEKALHCEGGNCEDDNHGKTPTARKSTNDLVYQATSLLKNVWIEAKGVSWQNDPALRQEMMDIYKACQMQLETYVVLSDHHEELLGKNGAKDMPKSKRKSLTSGTNDTTAFSSLSNDPTPLWDQSHIDNYHHNDRHANIQANTHGKVSKQNSRLKDALRSLRETEELAHEITGELDLQRSTLESTRSSMNSVKDMTQQAKGLLQSMNKKWWTKW